MSIPDEEAEAYIRDDEERKQYQDFKVGNRKMPLSNNVLMLLGGLLQPQTEGLNHINLDMAFTNLDPFSLYNIENSSFLIVYFSLWGFHKADIMERNKLATALISRRSLNGKSMDLFTTVTTKQSQEFLDKTEKKTGFANLWKKNKGQPEG